MQSVVALVLVSREMRARRSLGAERIGGALWSSVSRLIDVLVSCQPWDHGMEIHDIRELAHRAALRPALRRLFDIMAQDLVLDPGEWYTAR